MVHSRVRLPSSEWPHQHPSSVLRCICSTQCNVTETAAAAITLAAISVPIDFCLSVSQSFGRVNWAGGREGELDTETLNDGVIEAQRGSAWVG